MEDQTVIPAAPSDTKKPFIMFRIWQWTAVVIFALFIVMLVNDLAKLSLPDAPVVRYWATLIVWLALAGLNSPPAFFRLPRKSKWAVYGAILPAIILFGSTMGGIQRVYEKTAQGANEAAERAQHDQAKAEAEAKQREARATLQKFADSQQQMQEMADKLESCFTTFGHRLPTLEDQVRNSLHNPHAFEHVETFAIMPDPEGYDVVMEFRAENGFGAVRTARVKAKVVPGSCEINAISKDEVAN